MVRNDNTLLYRMALTQIPGVGSIIGKKLVSYCGGVEAVFKEKKRNLLKIPGVGSVLVRGFNRNEALAKAEKEIKFIEKGRIKPIFYLDKEYPQRLTHCIDGPLMLFYRGIANLNSPRIVSIVGTRKATNYGRYCCQKIVEGLADSNVLIISGLAYGIDTCAHRSSLINGIKTIGVLAHGLDRIYPWLNRKLAGQMVKEGGLITEFFSGTLPDRENFPKRNRIIAGMADAVVVIEAAYKGGALITAEIANSYNREVFAIPGRIDNQYSVGCNQMIKMNKAALAESAEDIKFIMGWERSVEETSSGQTRLFIDLSEEEETIINLLETNGKSGIDWISLSSNMSMSKVASVLLHLEFKGLIKSLPGKIYTLY